MTHNSEVAGLRRKVEALERRLPGSPMKQRAIKGRQRPNGGGSEVKGKGTG